MGKHKVLISEQDLVSLLTKAITSGNFQELLKLLANSKNKDNSKKETSKIPKTSGEFLELDLNNPTHYDAYRKVADEFIQSRSSNLLNLNGKMFADSAKKVFNRYGKYVPVELSMAQLAAEGAFSNNPNARPIRTKNPYNVGNVDSGKNVFHSTVQNGIDIYYDKIAKNYLTAGKTASDLINNFVNKDNLRYASAKNYEQVVRSIANRVKKISQSLFSSLK
jgi:hypothetical protein